MADCEQLKSYDIVQLVGIEHRIIDLHSTLTLALRHLDRLHYEADRSIARTKDFIKILKISAEEIGVEINKEAEKKEQD